MASQMIIINGKRYSGSSVTVVNNRVIIDGVDVTSKDMPKTILNIEVKGKLANLITDASVNCDNICGDVRAAGSVSCDDVGGSVTAGGSVSCDDVGGNVQAGGSVSHE